MLQAHSLELSLANLLMTNLVDQEIGEEKFKSELARVKRLTMGRLIAEVIDRYEISDYWKEEFDNSLFFRNRLAHQISEDIISSHIREDGRAKLISEMEEIIGYFREAKGEIERITDKWLILKGIERAQLLEVAKSWLEQSKAN